MGSRGARAVVLIGPWPSPRMVLGSSWCASWFDLRFGIVFAPSSALLGMIFGLLWCHLRPSWGQFSVPGYRFGVFFWLFGSMFVCHLSMCFCSTFAFPFLDAACLFSICGCFAFAFRFVHGALRARALRTARCAIKSAATRRVGACLDRNQILVNI